MPKTPEAVAHNRKCVRARDAAMRELTRRHAEEWTDLLNEVRASEGLPPVIHRATKDKP